MAFDYPLSMDLHGLSCLVVGGGSVALRKVRTLLQAEALVTVVAPEYAAAFSELDGHQRVQCVKRAFVDEDIEGRALVFAATDDRAVNAHIYALCSGRQIPVNVVDSREESRFIVPAVLRKGDLSIAITTNGLNPGYAKALKAHLNALIDDDFLAALEVATRVRAVIKARVDQQAEREALLRRIDLNDLLREVRTASIDDVVRKVTECLLS